MEEQTQAPVDPLVEEAAALDALIDEAVSKNQDLGMQIDAIRDRRRELVAQISKWQARRDLITIVKQHPNAKNAIVPGAVSIVTGREVLEHIVNGGKKE